MERKLLVVLLLLLSVSAAQAQRLSLGVNAGLPIGEAADFTNFQVGADVAYRFGLLGMVEVGPMLGYSHFFGDSGEAGDLSWEVDDVQFVPIAASGRANLATLTAGLDLGYALGLNDGNEGGFYYRPSVGFNILMIGLILSYQGISSDEGIFSSVNLGVEFGL